MNVGLAVVAVAPLAGSTVVGELMTTCGARVNCCVGEADPVTPSIAVFQCQKYVAPPARLPSVRLVVPLLPSAMPSLVKTLLANPASAATSTEYVAVLAAVRTAL